MSSTTQTGASKFSLSMLINDTRYRSTTFQVIALIGLIFAMGYLVSNLLSNLADAGLNISWRFFGETAGYDINQMPIEYNNQMSHGRASLVGAVNTLIVAFLACVSATILGVIAGVLRLSNNWGRFKTHGHICGSLPQCAGFGLDFDHFSSHVERLAATP